MLSDDSSSDSETGRFKGKSEKQDEGIKSSRHNLDSFRSRGRDKASKDERYNRDFDRRRIEKDHYGRNSKDRSRQSLVDRRRRSKDRSPYRRRSQDRQKYKDSRDDHKSKYRNNSRDRQKHSRSRSSKSSDRKKNPKDDMKKNEIPQDRNLKSSKKSRENSSSPDLKVKRSEVHKPILTPARKRSSISPKAGEPIAKTKSTDVQEGSYYSMVPAVVKELTDESSEIDSSDDERLRAKLLNLEKELHKTQKKKHKKKSKKRSSKSDRDNDLEITSVEVSSTTDVQDKIKTDSPKSQTDVTEVTSTQKTKEKESSEEGEISSDDNSQDLVNIDPTDLRHKLIRSRVPKSHSPDLRDKLKIKTEVCGPALPPHLEQHFRESESCGIEGPALPPKLQNSKNIGPFIPADMRKTLAESSREIIKYESTDEEDGIGPLPVGADDKWSEAHQRLEVRALDMKIRKLDGYSMQKSDVKSREQWMLELPEAKAKILGLEARTFRAKEGPDMSDRSSWTDTPEDKSRKAAGLRRDDDADLGLEKEARARAIANRDSEQEKAIKKHKKKHKREESLLEIHQKKLKKKKKKEDKDDEKKERRPFSRDIDLEVNRFDEAQKKSIIKKAQNLNARFSRGEAKYL